MMNCFENLVTITIELFTFIQTNKVYKIDIGKFNFLFTLYFVPFSLSQKVCLTIPHLVHFSLQYPYRIVSLQ